MSFRKKLVLKNFAVPILSLEYTGIPFVIPTADNFMTVSLLHRCHIDPQLFSALYSRVLAQSVDDLGKKASIACFVVCTRFTGDGYTWILTDNVKVTHAKN